MKNDRTRIEYKAYSVELGVQAMVTIGSMGYHASQFDLDAGEYVLGVKAFPTFEQARTYADKCVGL